MQQNCGWKDLEKKMLFFLLPPLQYTEYIVLAFSFFMLSQIYMDIT